MNRNSEYIQQVLGGQGETLDSLTSMIDVLGEKLKGSSSACMDLVEKLSSLDSLIDDEKRKWVVQVRTTQQNHESHVLIQLKENQMNGPDLSLINLFPSSSELSL